MRVLHKENWLRVVPDPPWPLGSKWLICFRLTYLRLGRLRFEIIMVSRGGILRRTRDKGYEGTRNRSWSPFERPFLSQLKAFVVFTVPSCLVRGASSAAASSCRVMHMGSEQSSTEHRAVPRANWAGQDADANLAYTDTDATARLLCCGLPNYKLKFP